MNSNRHQFQQVLESRLGCPSPSLLKSFKSNFESLVVDDILSHDLRIALKNDAHGIYFKVSMSIAEAILSISKGHQSWAIVKLYYASFYLVRLAYASRGYGIFRCSGLYTLNTSKNARAVKRNGQGDHKTIINAFVKDFGSSEFLLSNTIGGEQTFEWLMSKRESIHYRDVTFMEPMLSHFEVSLSKGQIGTWISNYLDEESNIYCFLADHAGLAIPICFCKQILSELNNNGVNHLLNPEQKKTINTLLDDAGISGYQNIINVLTY